jgi:hypothetical protein
MPVPLRPPLRLLLRSRLLPPLLAAQEVIEQLEVLG